jgi:hypothetical protein
MRASFFYFDSMSNLPEFSCMRAGGRRPECRSMIATFVFSWRLFLDRLLSGLAFFPADNLRS